MKTTKPYFWNLLCGGTISPDFATRRRLRRLLKSVKGTSLVGGVSNPDSQSYESLNHKNHSSDFPPLAILNQLINSSLLESRNLPTKWSEFFSRPNKKKRIGRHSKRYSFGIMGNDTLNPQPTLDNERNRKCESKKQIPVSARRSALP